MNAMTPEQLEQQRQIRTFLQVEDHFDAAEQAERRIAFLVTQMLLIPRRALVLGISGGVDSTVAGRLAQLAVERVRAQGHAAKFIAVRLPYGRQHDESDAQSALDFIQPDEVHTVDIKGASDAMLQALEAGGAHYVDAAQRDFVLGNIKARQRMIAQYALSGPAKGMVIGTDHAAEAVMGFFTKFGDGGFDAAPLYGLTKRRVRAIGQYLGAPAALVQKVPTADLEDLAPQRPDEAAFGITYAQIDDFLEGQAVEAHVYERIATAYRQTAHKRALATVP